MNRKQRNAKTPPSDDCRLVYKQAEEGILFIGTVHGPVSIFPRDEIARLKERVEKQDRLFFEGSARLHFQRNADGCLINKDSVEWVAFGHHKGESIFLDDLNTANRFELAKRHGLRPFAFAGLYASLGLVMNVENGFVDSNEAYHATIRYLDTVRGWGEQYFPIKGSGRAAQGAIEAATICQERFGSLGPLGEITDTFVVFNAKVRDAEIYGPLMRDVVSKAGGKNGVVIGSNHIENMLCALEGREIAVPDWSVYVERMSDDAKAVWKKLKDALTRVGV